MTTNISLSKEIADALCTIIVLGYSANINGVRFEYDQDKDKAEYESVQTKFKKLGVEITVGKSEEKSDFPLIVGKTGSVAMFGKEQAKVELSEVHKFANILEKAAEKGKGKQKFSGAYVGGFAAIGTVDIIGASDLSLYEGKYRTQDLDKVEKSYQQAKEVSNAVIEAISSYFGGKVGAVKIDGIKIRNPYMNEKVTEDYKPGHLFKSYHGMIKAMTTFMRGFERTKNFFFEIALTSDTSKVSSCFPCATFMRANKNPPTSTHLGRGDNWSIPDGADYLKKPWEKSIIEWYNKGMKIINQHDSKTEVIEKWQEFVDTFQPKIEDKNIPEIFLESLTFEGSFTKKINETL
jgi:hypothetical protein